MEQNRKPLQPTPGIAIVAIDPGSEYSAWAIIDRDGEFLLSSKEPNDLVLRRISRSHFDTEHMSLPCQYYIEYPQPRGQTMSWQLINTIWWAGRFAERSDNMSQCVDRKDVKLHWTGLARAKDSQIRAAIIEKYGGKEKAIGKKADPGIFYGVKADEWQAAALGFTVHEGGAYPLEHGPR